MNYEAKRICEAERKHKERKARAKGSSSESLLSTFTCSICNRQFRPKFGYEQSITHEHIMFRILDVLSQCGETINHLLLQCRQNYFGGWSWVHASVFIPLHRFCWQVLNMQLCNLCLVGNSKTRSSHQMIAVPSPNAMKHS